MSGSDATNNETCVTVATTAVTGTTTALQVFATPYTMSGVEVNVFCDVTSGAITVNLPSVDRNGVGAEGGGPSAHPLRGKEVRIQSNGAAANAVTLNPASTGSTQAAPAIDGGSAGATNATLLPASLRRAVVLVFDGLNWNVISKSPSTNT